MSMFSTTVNHKDFKRMAAGGRGATVDGGDYEVIATGECKHYDPGSNGIGSYNVALQITENNENEDTHEDVLISRFQYDPSPADSGREKMNEITLQNMAKLIEASGVEPTTGPDGSVDLAQAMQSILATEPKFMITVSHNEKGYQDVGNFRPAV